MIREKIICVVDHHEDLKFGQEYLLSYNSSLNDKVAYIYSLKEIIPLGYFPSEFFMTPEDWREEQINKILDEESNLYKIN